MSNDREIAALKRRLDRHINWGAAARAHAQDMLSDDPLVRRAGEGWWRQTLNQPRVVLSPAEGVAPTPEKVGEGAASLSSPADQTQDSTPSNSEGQ